MTEIFTGVRVFDGDRLLDGRWDVATDGSIIAAVERAGSPIPEGAATIDGSGATLLPGLIDAHVHLRGPDDLLALGRWGVTTALDMGSWSTIIGDLRRAGSTDVRGTGAAAMGPGNPLGRQPGRPGDSIVADAEAGRRFVAARVSEGVDFIKVIVDPPGRGGLETDAIGAIVTAAHAAGRLVVAHASNTDAVRMAQDAGVDVLTHAPLDADLDAAGVDEVLRSGRTVVPTLVMMEGVAANVPVPGLDYAHARASVTALHAAGVPIVLGTDANQAPGVPANVPYGEGVHRELELLVEAGLTPAEALHAATGAAADRFGLPDRGRIAVGLRADLVLVEGDPAGSITASRAIREVRLSGRAAG
ncbi:amidohydrolase family protein [uncultured Amnibacterium sp.]|uniref:amidohydrolase family protein n=1 Tax=uncultured Amnibacterium sp. TaxID=1631851 RepID=UPI0035CA9377